MDAKFGYEILPIFRVLGATFALFAVSVYSNPNVVSKMRRGDIGNWVWRTPVAR